METVFKRGDKVVITRAFTAFFTREKFRESGLCSDAIEGPLIPGEIYDVLDLVAMRDMAGTPVAAVALRSERDVPHEDRIIRSGAFKGSLGLMGRGDPVWVRDDELSMWSRLLVGAPAQGGRAVQPGGDLARVLDDAVLQKALADRDVAPWQHALEPGDYVISNEDEEELLWWAEILDPTRGCTAEESDHMTSFCGPGSSYRFVRAFSRKCPHGETGDWHLSQINSPVTRTEFEEAGKRDWPTNRAAIARALSAACRKNADEHG